MRKPAPKSRAPLNLSELGDLPRPIDVDTSLDTVVEVPEPVFAMSEHENLTHRMTRSYENVLPTKCGPHAVGVS